MLEAIVGVALRAILASVLFGAVLSGMVLIVTRRLALTAATRHALWTTAMIATAAMPLAGVAVSLARATPAHAPAAAGGPATAGAPAVQVANRSGRALSAGTTSAGDALPEAANRRAKAGTLPPPVDATAVQSVPGALAAWSPRVTRALALGVVAIWSLGALIGMIGLAFSVVRIRGLKRRSSPLDGALADQLPWLTASGPGREIYLRLSYEIETPVAIGFGRPVILIPTELTGDGGLAALEPLVLHEHAHLRRYDDWTNLVQRTIERMFWFNPIVWLVGRRIALEREIASDDAVVEKTGRAHEYATSLWRLAREMRMPEHAVVAPGALLTRKQIAVRIEELLAADRNRRHPSPAVAFATALAGIVAVAFVATSAPAVELPAKPDAVAATQTSTKPQRAAQFPERVARHDAGVPAPSRVAKQPVKVAVAKKPSAPAAKPAPASTRTVYVYVPVPSKVGAAKTAASSRVAMASQRRSVARSGDGDDSDDDDSSDVAPPAPQPAHVIPVTPVTPVAPAAPPAPAAIRAVAKSAAAASAAGKSAAAAAAFGSALGEEIGGAVGRSLSRLPRELAQVDEDDVKGAHHLPSGTKLTRDLLAACNGCALRNANLRGMDLHGITLRGDDLSGADLRGTNLAGATLTGVSLRDANLSNADLRGARLNGVELRGAALTGARLNDLSLVGISLRGQGVTGVSLRELLLHCTGCDLSHMDLHGQDLHGVTLTGADFSRSNLRAANLSGAHLMGVDLSFADLSGADLSNAQLDGCDLRGVALRDANTTGMTMHGTSLDG
jgi:uncharacterized protein YjbI with pentapeptide repeats/beta-lactamase regulating signal transducer with metallopeptidase domain